MKIHFRDTSVRLYSGRELLIRGQITLAPGETVLVIGPNASGKTLLLNALASLFEPEEVGAIDRMDRASVNIGPQDLALRGISWLRQEPSSNFLSRCSADEMVLPFMHRRFGRDEIEQLINDVLIEADIDDTSLLSRPIARMSSGQRQRLAYCIAVAPRPGLLLLDEPFARLDQASQKKLAGLVGSHEGDCCRVVVTHQPHVFEQLARVDRHVVIQRTEDLICIEESAGPPPGDGTPLAELLDAAESHPLLASFDLSWLRARMLDTPEPVNHPRFITSEGEDPCLASTGIRVRVGRREISRVGSFKLSSGVNLLVGQNGSGKTSLAEALAGTIPLNPVMHLPGAERKRAYGLVSGKGRFEQLSSIRRSGRSVLLPAEPRTWLYRDTVEDELVGTFPDLGDVRRSVSTAVGLHSREVPGDLSYGQQRALSLLTLPSREMDIVVLDEFFSDLSVHNSGALFEYVYSRVRNGDWRVVVISTANLRSFFVNLLHGATL